MYPGVANMKYPVSGVILYIYSLYVSLLIVETSVEELSKTMSEEAVVTPSKEETVQQGPRIHVPFAQTEIISEKLQKSSVNTVSAPIPLSPDRRENGQVEDYF